jgi:hypothetical protein
MLKKKEGDNIGRSEVHRKDVSKNYLSSWSQTQKENPQKGHTKKPRIKLDTHRFRLKFPNGTNDNPPISTPQVIHHLPGLYSSHLKHPANPPHISGLPGNAPKKEGEDPEKEKDSQNSKKKTHNVHDFMKASA